MNIATLKKDFIAIITIFLVLFAVTYCTNVIEREAGLTIVYSNDVLGETEPCG